MRISLQCVIQRKVHHTRQQENFLYQLLMQVMVDITIQHRLYDYAQPLPATTKLEGKALEILQPIVDKYKGKYVQIEWMKPRKSGVDFVNNRMVNLIPDFRNHKDLQFVFLFSANTCTKEEFEQFVKAYLPGEACYWLDFEESSILRAQLLLPNYIKDITLNREGEVLSTPLYTADERQFRRSLRELLEKEE